MLKRPMSTSCEFCGVKITHKNNLLRHQKTIKCIKEQKKNNKYAENTQAESFVCEYCKKPHNRLDALKRHEMKYCPSREAILNNKEKLESFKDENSLLRQEIASLKTKIESQNEIIKILERQLSEKEKSQNSITLAAVSRPTTSVRNTIKNAVIQNLLPIKEDEMKVHVPFLTIDHIKEGAEGYAKFALERPFKNRITCTDASRKKLAWKNEEGELVYDTEGQALCKKFFAVIHAKSENLFRELIKELGERLGSAYDRQDQEEADTIVELTDKVQTWRREAFQASKGNFNELTLEFASYLCKMSSRSTSA